MALRPTELHEKDLSSAGSRRAISEHFSFSYDRRFINSSCGLLVESFLAGFHSKLNWNCFDKRSQRQRYSSQIDTGGTAGAAVKAASAATARLSSAIRNEPEPTWHDSYALRR